METEKVKTKKPRPYFFVDLKWVFGILFTISFGITILFYNLYFLTQKDNLTKITKPIIQQLLIPNGLPAEQYQVILDYARMYPDDIISIPDSPFQLEIKGSEVLDLKKEEFESLLIENMVKKIQEGRIDEFFTSTLEGNKEGQPSGIFNFLLLVMSFRFNSIVKTIFIINLISSIIWFIPFFIFSHRFGKIASPGISFLIISLPTINGMKIGEVALNVFLKESLAVGPALRLDLLSMYDAVYKSYFYLFILGLVLIIISLVLSIIFHFRKQKT